MDQYDALAQALRRACPALELREHEPMARHTTFRIGGPARLMALPKTEEEAVSAVVAAYERDIIPFFLGNGSDLLVSDRGVEGFLLKTADGLDDIYVNGAQIRAGSGALLSRIACAARDAGLTGLEFAHGIPGSLGGGVTMNAGAYDGELCQVVTAVRCLDADGGVTTLSGAQLDFSYRHSAFSGGERLILSADLTLSPGDPAAIGARMAELMERRRAKQPLEFPSGGSTFKRPPGHFAAALIDGCGLKGARVGGAEVSEKHAGFVINRGGATCEDVLRLVDLVRQTVLDQTGVTLELEIKTLGI